MTRTALAAASSGGPRARMVPIWLDMGFENEVLGDRGAPHACGDRGGGAADWGAAIGAAAVVSASPTRAPADTAGRASGAPGRATGETGLPWELCGAVVGLSWAAALPWATPGAATGVAPWPGTAAVSLMAAGPSDGAGPDALGEPAGVGNGAALGARSCAGRRSCQLPGGAQGQTLEPCSAGRGVGGRGTPRAPRRRWWRARPRAGRPRARPAAGRGAVHRKAGGQASRSLGSTSSASATRTSVHSVMFASPASIFCQSRQ